MTKHTPGEWIDRGTNCVGTRWQLVASVYPMEDENPEEHAANARLIAASPDLLEALKDMVNLVELMCPFDGPQQRKARAAIARATGEQP